MSALSTLKGVGVGAGYFSHFQYQAWKTLPQVEMVAICNRSTPKAEAMAHEYGIARVYGIDAYDRMLDETQPDFVDIITPPETHLSLVETAADRGLAVICQKPLASTWEGCLALRECVVEHGVRFMVHENWRWQPWYREIKRLLQDGVIGHFFHAAMQTRLGDGWGDDAYLSRQPFFREYPRLFLYETGVHFIDTFRYLFGEVSSVYARIDRRNPVIRGEDSAFLLCSLENGGTTLLDANRYNESEADDPRYTFGTLRIDGSRGHLELQADGSLIIKPLGEPARRHPYMPSREGFAGNCVQALQHHFVEAMLSNEPFESNIDDYLRSVRLVEAAYESAAKNVVIHSSDFLTLPDA